MPEVLEIEQETQESREAAAPKWNSWVMELPKEIVEANDLPAGTLVALTLENGAVKGEIILPSAERKESLRRFIEKYGDFLEEMKKLSD
jgi:antitoxin component of MazEF toxin-antitoxin module